jgi:hypothetical protein
VENGETLVISGVLVLATAGRARRDKPAERSAKGVEDVEADGF